MAIKTKVVDIDQILPKLSNGYTSLYCPALPYEAERLFSSGQLEILNRMLSDLTNQISMEFHRKNMELYTAIESSSYEVERCFLCSKKVNDSMLPTAADLGIK